MGSVCKVVVTFINHVGRFFDLSSTTTGGVWILQYFFNLGSNAACFMCHHELWPTTLSHSFSLNSSLVVARWKHYLKINIPIFKLGLQKFAISDYSPYIILYPYIFPLLSSGWFVIAKCGSISVRELVKQLVCFVNWCRATISNDKST